jgi:3-phenylpropionate/trans-cinnamate dioxygenase ferredoxin reductase subunit
MSSTDSEGADVSQRQQTFAIVGAGLAGANAAEALRAQGFEARVLLYGDERERPYDRPPLPKEFLHGTESRDVVFIHPRDWYSDNGVELRLDTGITRVDRATHAGGAVDGSRVIYDTLLLTTGSSPRRLSVPGSDLDGVLDLRQLADAEALQLALARAARVAIVGAGWIGLETAAAARAADVAVTVLEVAPLPLVGALGPKLAAAYADLHVAHGVDLRLGVHVDEIIGGGGGSRGVRLADVTVVDADVVIVGVGITPNTRLAEEAGLTVANGVVVDQFLATSDPDIFAAGDVASVYYPHLDRHLRLDHWAAALNQCPTAAANMLGHATVYDRVPYFYSDQYDWGMEYSGYVPGGTADDVIIRGDLQTGTFIAFWMIDRRVKAGMNVNTWDVTGPIQALVRRTARSTHTRSRIQTSRWSQSFRTISRPMSGGRRARWRGPWPVARPTSSRQDPTPARPAAGRPRQTGASFAPTAGRPFTRRRTVAGARPSSRMD